MADETLKNQQLEGTISAETMSMIFKLAEVKLDLPQAITLLGYNGNLRYPRNSFEGETDLIPIRPQTEVIVVSFKDIDIAIARSTGRSAVGRSMDGDYEELSATVMKQGKRVMGVGPHLKGPIVLRATRSSVGGDEAKIDTVKVEKSNFDLENWRRNGVTINMLTVNPKVNPNILTPNDPRLPHGATTNDVPLFLNPLTYGTVNAGLTKKTVANHAKTYVMTVASQTQRKNIGKAIS